MIDMLRRFLLDEYHGSLNKDQIERLEKAIYDRLAKTINTPQFSNVLDRPFAQGGVGLNLATAQRLAERFEIILAQSYEVS